MKKKLSIAGIVLGLLLTVIGLKFALSGEAYYDSMKPADYSFGADFYTEQYSVTRDAVLNISRVGNCMNTNFHHVMQLSGFTVAIMGLIVSCYFGIQLSENAEKKAHATTESAPIVTIPVAKEADQPETETSKNPEAVEPTAEDENSSEVGEK